MKKLLKLTAIKVRVVFFMANFLFITFFAGVIPFNGQSVVANVYPVKVVGERHTLVLLSDGTIVGWGPCDSGELGPIAAIPQRRNWAKGFVWLKLPRKAVDIAAGESSSFALLDDGTVYSWGSNNNKMLGIGEVGGMPDMSNGREGAENPVRVANLSNVIQIAADGKGALALLKNGTVYAWGEKFKGPFGDGKTPSLIPGLSHITKISVGNWHFLALDADHKVWAWGENYCGQGRRTADLRSVAPVTELVDVISIAAGSCVSTAVKKDGTVWVWGSNGMSGFGNGQRTEGAVLQLTPLQVAGIRNAVAVSSGGMGRHTLVLLKDGTLRGWGNSDWGQIGAGVSGDFQPNPVTPKITGVKEIFAVQNNSFALRTDNSFWMWGASYGEFPLKVNSKVPKLLELK
jgi:alpha-tubulin suppressor-like RCC1 family protein